MDVKNGGVHAAMQQELHAAVSSPAHGGHAMHPESASSTVGLESTLPAEAEAAAGVSASPSSSQGANAGASTVATGYEAEHEVSAASKLGQNVNVAGIGLFFQILMVRLWAMLWRVSMNACVLHGAQCP